MTLLRRPQSWPPKRETSILSGIPARASALRSQSKNWFPSTVIGSLRPLLNKEFWARNISQNLKMLPNSELGGKMGSSTSSISRSRSLSCSRSMTTQARLESSTIAMSSGSAKFWIKNTAISARVNLLGSEELLFSTIVPTPTRERSALRSSPTSWLSPSTAISVRLWR